MNYQRSKAPLSLMEQLIMVFVFAFTAAVCLQAFVYSDNLSSEGTTKELAATRATEVAETCKAYRGDFSMAAGQLGASVVAGEAGDTLEMTYDEDELRVVIDTPQTESVSGDVAYQKTEVSVWDTSEDGDGADPVYTMSVAWQTADQTAR